MFPLTKTVQLRHRGSTPELLIQTKPLRLAGVRRQSWVGLCDTWKEEKKMEG